MRKLLLITLVILTACGGSSGPHAKIEFSYGRQGVTYYDSIYIEFKMEHLGGDSVRNVACELYAMRGDTILDSAFVLFAGGGVISAGQSAQEDAIFFDLTPYDNFDRYTIGGCDWLY